MPSLFKRKRLGRGVELSAMSSPWIGETTGSVLERSTPNPITEVSLEASFKGSEALFVSSLTSVVVKRPTVPLAESSLASG